MADVFISYAKSDRDLARMICEAIEARDLTAWWDAKLDSGSDYRATIAKELEAAGVVVVIWSAESINSAFVLDEADSAKAARKLVPVTFDPKILKAVPLGFGAIQVLNLTGWTGDPSDPRIGKLLEDIDLVRKRQIGDAWKAIGTRADQTDVVQMSRVALNSLAAIGVFGLPAHRWIVGAFIFAAALSSVYLLGASIAIQSSEVTRNVMGTAIICFVALLIYRAIHQVTTIARGDSSRRFFDPSFGFWSGVSAILAPVVYVLLTRAPVNFGDLFLVFPFYTLACLGLILAIRLASAGLHRLFSAGR